MGLISRGGTSGARGWVCMGMLALASGLGCDDDDAPGGERAVVFVAGAEGGTVTVVDAEGLEVLGVIDVLPDGPEPEDPERAQITSTLNAAAGANFAQDQDVAPDGRTLYVSRGHRADVAAFEVATGARLWSVPVEGFRADHMAISHDGGHLFVSDIFENAVRVIDTEAGAIVGSFPTGTWPHDNHLSPDGARVYNASIGAIEGDSVDLLRDLYDRPPAEHDLEALGIDPSTVDDLDALHLVTVVDLASREVLGTHRFEQGVRPFAITGDERLLYAQLSNFHGLVEYDLEAKETLRTLDLPVADEAQDLDSEDYPFAAPHHGLALSPDETLLCVAGRVSNYAALVRREDLELAARVPVGASPGWAANGPNGRHCFIASEQARTVSVLSYETLEEVARIPIDDAPKHMVAARIPEGVARALERGP
ncbi:MAG: YncE family protein [Myxococcota bacterium]